MVAVSTPVFMLSITPAIEWTVSRRPQNVPKQAEENQKTDEIAAELASLVEPGGDRIQYGAGGDGREAARARARGEHRRHGREQ